MRLVCTLCLSAFLMFAMTVTQQPKLCSAFVEPEGSFPPLPQLYSCVRALDGKPYNAAGAKSCLDSILASGYFESGRIQLSPKKLSLFVAFILKAPPLVVRKVDFVVDGSLKERMLQWIRNTGQIINAGEVYQAKRDERTVDILLMYFWDIGKRAGVTRKVDLDYQAGTADLTYRIIVGPGMVPMRALPPFNPRCKISISVFNLTDTDDYVPVNLAEKMTNTHAFGCFDARTVSGDQETLKNSNLFHEAQYEIQGRKDDKQVLLHLRGKQLKVREVRVVGYGMFSGETFPNDTGLVLQVGDTYRRSAAHSTLEYLQNKYAHPDEIVEVFEDDQLTDDKDLIVTFQLFASDEDRVLVNGKEFRVVPIVVTGHP